MRLTNEDKATIMGWGFPEDIPQIAEAAKVTTYKLDGKRIGIKKL